MMGRGPVAPIPLAAFVLATTAAVASLTPVTKVLEMLADMKAKGVKDMETEQNVFEQYEKFVRRKSLDLELEIKTSTAAIEELEATIAKAETTVKEATNKIAEIDAETAEAEASQKKATALRQTEHEKFLETQTSYAESLYALDRAIEVLGAQNYDRAQAMALLQKAAKNVRGMRKVFALLQIELATEGSQPSGAPAVAAYEFQSGAILDILAKLKDRFRKELSELETEETNSEHAYDMQMLHLGDIIAGLKKNREELLEVKAKAAAEAAAAKGELADTQASLAEAKEFLADIEATFEMKNAAFHTNQKVRKDEIATLGEAINIISTPEVSSSYSEHIALPQAPSAKQVATLLQVHRASTGRSAVRQRATTYLQGRASALRSEVLATVAQQLQDNPFAKVIDMIKELLERLQDEASSEAEHKAYCDEELHNNKLKRKEAEAEISRLTAEIEEKAMEIAGMTTDISDLAAAEASLASAMEEATAQRQKEKPVNLATIEDAKEGQVGVKQAIIVLREFYAKQAEALLQIANKKKQVPEMKEYQGMQRLKGGVVAMLEVIESDFARLQTDTEAAEATADPVYG
jgi:hypothetical protein